MNRMTITFFYFFLCFILTTPAWSLSGQNVVELKKAGVSGTVKNLSGTKRRSVAFKKTVKTKGTGPRRK